MRNLRLRCARIELTGAEADEKRVMNRRYQRIVAVLCVVAALVTIGVAPGQTAASAPSQRIVYLIPGISGNAFYTTMEHGARRTARALGISLVYRGSPYSFSASAQIPYLDNAIAQHPDAILIAPADKRALNAPIRRAVRAGIPVITVDTSITQPLAVTSISSNNTRGGALAAVALARIIHFKGGVAGLSIQPGVSTTDARERGFAEQIKRYPNIRYLGTQYANDSLSRAAQITDALLKRKPPVAGVFAMNVVSGDGAISAIAAAHQQRAVKVVEFDADPLEVLALRQKLVDSLIAQDPWAMGSLAVRLANRWISGHRSGIKKRYTTREVILTRGNIDSPTLKHFRYLGG